jgi:putative endonuclease
MAHYVYVLVSESSGRYYVGSSSDPWRRLGQHNAGESRSTKSGRPWQLVAVEAVASGSEARQLEARLKAKRSRRSIERFVERAGSGMVEDRARRPAK